jgi:uncharacterized protein (TIGR04255 family)
MISPQAQREADFCETKAGMVSTPKFRKPPVIETVLGVQFEPLRSMRITHFGLFWELIKDEFPEVEHHPSLEPVKESFDNPPLPSSPVWKVMREAEFPRAWFLSRRTEHGQQLVQLQQDRLIQNWRRANLSTEHYSSYQKNRSNFERTLKCFLDFMAGRELGVFEPNQCEVTYINHIPLDEGLTVGGMSRKCFPSLDGHQSAGFLPPDAEQLALKAGYEMPGKQGRLSVEVQPAWDLKTRQRFLRLALTARGAPHSPTVEGVLSWLDDLGHVWVVKGFESFTSKEMHDRWELIAR